MGGTSSSITNTPLQYSPNPKSPKEHSLRDIDFISPTLYPTAFTGDLSQRFTQFSEFLHRTLDVNQQVADFTIQNKDQEYESLADMYFDSSYKTLQFCNALISRSRLVKTNRIVFEYVKNKLKEEDKQGIDGNKTLVEELKRLNESISGFFDQDFLKLFRSVYKKHIALSKELRKHTNTKHTKYSKGFEIKWHEVRLLENTNKVSFAISVCNLKDFVRVSMVEKINKVIHRLETLMDFDESDESLLADMDRIMEDMDEFTSGIEELGQRAEMCSRKIMAQRTQVRNHLLSE